MPQIGIVTRDGKFFREYAPEVGDSVESICLHFGLPDWRSVYEDPENSSFHALFPDPNHLVPGQSINLLVPLVGMSRSGVSVHGAPLGDYLSAHMVDTQGASLPNVTVRLIEPGVPSSVARAVTTSPNGDIFIPNP